MVKGVSSTLILGGVEKKLLRLRAIATESLGFLPNRPESGILLGAPIPLSRPLVELLRALVLCRTTQFAVIMRRDFPCPCRQDALTNSALPSFAYGNQLVGWINCKVGRRRPIPTQTGLIQCLLEKNRRVDLLNPQPTLGTCCGEVGRVTTSDFPGMSLRKASGSTQAALSAVFC